MKKIWNLLGFIKQYLFWIIIGLCVIIVIALIEKNHNVTPVEGPTINIDSIKGVNSRIEEEIIKLDSIKYEEISKVDSIDNNDAVNMFWWLLSK